MGLENDFKFHQSAETVNAGVELSEIVTALRNDAEFFINFFLGDELTHAVPEFHKESWDYLNAQNISRFALALPRGHAKTTLAKLVVVWYLLFTDVRFVIYVSNTHAMAAAACKDIINYMRSINFTQVFGDIIFSVEQDAKGNYEFELGYIDGQGLPRSKKCILKAFGAGQQVRGLNIDNVRPQLAVVDDLEDNENTATPELILKLRGWFFGPFYKAMAIKNKIIYLGNMLSAQSLLYHFCENSDQWHSMRFGCLRSDGTPLWNDMWPIEKIKADFLEYQKLGLTGKWFAEMMNMPMADGNLLIAADEIYYVPQLVPGEQEAAFITIDSAISQKEHADFTAICVHVLKDGLWRTVEYMVGRYSPDQIFWLLVELCLKWQTRIVGMQRTAFEMAFKFLFEVLMTVHSQHFEICLIEHGNRSKHERISIWCSLMRRKQWAINEGEYAITEQLLMYDPAKKTNRDDLADSASMGATMIEVYLPAILSAYTIDATGWQVRGELAVSRI